MPLVKVSGGKNSETQKNNPVDQAANTAAARASLWQPWQPITGNVPPGKGSALSGIFAIR
jgi:hypothetical protein